MLRLLNIMNVSTFSRSLQSFCFRFLHESETHVEKRAGAEFWSRFCHDEAKANESCTGQGKAKKFGVSSVPQFESLECKK